ncbi:MAG TPA: (d)CMP kinase [Elusimicrobiales bacterium]|nr:(d)CMP kinase [Elusimicrobiales bacterium]HOL61980.1 (d)CMP kinase [Elusimicrobiales bacterium]HPO94518.1 (d)CMP kinase [Elusimicrobiales bacterium]
MRKNGIIIAIDGPAGGGKSSVGKIVAEKIGYKFISSGKMYRAIAWLCVKKEVNIDDEEKVLEIARTNPISFKENSGVEPLLLISNTVLDKELYDENIAAATSKIARMLNLRNFLVEEQRRLGRDGGIIMEGRDITTNVFPDAELKIYLDASAQARAERRVAQLREKGMEANYREILDMIIKRDEQDAKRKHNPLKKSEDSHYIDSTNMKKEDVVNLILKLYEQTLSKIKK